MHSEDPSCVGRFRLHALQHHQELDLPNEAVTRGESLALESRRLNRAFRMVQNSHLLLWFPGGSKTCPSPRVTPACGQRKKKNEVSDLQKPEADFIVVIGTNKEIK